MHAGGMGGEGKIAPGPQAVPLGQRERKADQRKAFADERQRLLDERARAVTAEVEQLQEQSRVLIERSQALLAGNSAPVTLITTVTPLPKPAAGQSSFVTCRSIFAA